MEGKLARAAVGDRRQELRFGLVNFASFCFYLKKKKAVMLSAQANFDI